MPIKEQNSYKVTFRSFISFIYTLTDKSDRLSAFLRLSPLASQNNVEVFNLKQIKDYTLPEDPQGFTMANVVVIDEIAIADLSQKEQESLLNWVQNGGTLIVGAADQLNATAGIFKDYLPLALSKQMTSVSANSLSKLSGGGTFTQPISIYEATENKGSIPVLTDSNKILASKKKLAVEKLFKQLFFRGSTTCIYGWLPSISGKIDKYSKDITTSRDSKWTVTTG